MARDFSEDGAFGAGMDADGAGPSPSSNAPAASGPSSQGWADYTTGMANHTPGHYTSGPNGLGYSPLTDAENASMSAFTSGLANHTPGTYKSGGGVTPSFTPMGFSEGGAIDEDPNATDPQGSAMGNQLQQQINQALGIIDGTLAYGRKLHGIGSDDGAIKQAGAMPSIPGNQSESGIPPRRPQPPNPLGKQASAMPSRPGNQSESGIQPQQPMPGPLPPTSNPFGKRADASEGEQEQEPEGAIDTEEPETA